MAEESGVGASAEVEDLELQPSMRVDQSKRKSGGPVRSSIVDTGERVDVDRSTLEAILDVSSRIQNIQKKSKVSMSTLAFGHESYKDKQVNKHTE